MSQRWVESGGVRLSVYEDGPVGGAVVVLVHGYPDNASVWDGVVRELATTYRVVRYDVRGAGQSGAPDGRDGYRIPRLVEDLVAVIGSVGGGPVHLVAHDWGSIQAWGAISDPSLRHLFASYTSISGPDLDHIGAWMRTARKRDVLRQLLHSWYIGAFQVPVVPELVWRVPGLRKKFGAAYRDARNGVELYRANMVNRLASPGARRTGVPVQQVALTLDPFVTPAILESADAWCERLWRREVGAGHWAVRDRPATITRLITEFIEHLGGQPAGRELARALVGGPQGFDRQLALVTGAGSGIGRATALALGEAGADVLCVDIDLAAAEKVAAAVGGSAFQLDVADSVATKRLAERIHSEHGVPDLVMANAGIAVSGSFLDTSEEDWKRIIDVNLWGVINTLKAFVPPLVERGEGGHVVVTASAAGYLVSPSLPAYSATKAAVLMLAQCLAGELKSDGIGVSAICPGFVHTNITNTTRFAGASPDEERNRQRNTTAMYKKRGFGPEKVAVEVLAAIRDKKVVVPITPEAKVGALATRLAPNATRAFARWVDGLATRRM